MTPWTISNIFNIPSQVRLKSEPYLVFNIVFTGIILLMMLYFGIFSPEKDNYPITCLHQKLTGEPCVSCGLSHSFSLILRGRVAEAYNWNIYGMRVFLFFASQLFLRIVFSLIYLRYPGTSKQLIILDIIGSSVIFLISFWHFFAYIFKFS
ncbi:MAG: hypothetical protein A2V50_05945 [Bacteroidetes bacterium RBG_19FT_COMBO_42_10]|nr:MAG: hypothetical protein A2V50_05945 [Bacteroidetes bacterium RBG_19FT_COMBO_42_10]